MKIKKLKINSFGKLEDKEIEFSDQINLISGKNESGKSTLLKFIVSMLYGVSKTKNGKTISDFERYKPWGKEDYSGSLKYVLDDNTEYEIYREFKKKTPIIYDKNKNDITKNFSIDKTKESLFFTEQTGIIEENFLSSCVTEQENNRLSNNMKNSIIQKLSNIVSTGKENTSYKKTIDKINKEQLEKIGNNRSSGRPINEIENQIEEKEKKRQEISFYENKKYEVDTQKEDLRINTQENEVVLELLRGQKTNLEKNLLEKEKIKIFKENLQEEAKQKLELEKKLEKLEGQKKENLENKHTPLYISILLIFIITVISIFTSIWYIIILNVIPIIYIIIQATSKNKKRQKIKENNKKIYQEKNLIEERIESIEKNYLIKEKDLNEKEAVILQSEKELEENLKEKFKNKLDSETIADILSTRYERIVEFINEKELEKTEYKIAEKTIEVDNQNILKQLENLVELDEELEKLYNKKEELLELNDMYELVKKEIENAYQEMKENITPGFIEEFKRILKKVTKEKYTEIYLDDENNILIETEKGDYIPVERLSSGTIDLIYLALRISATKEISNENMPIIIDESLVYYDNERMAETLKYLATYEDRQIIILTCSDREKAILERESIQYTEIKL